MMIRSLHRLCLMAMTLWALPGLGAPGSALAHPHVFAEARLGLRFTGKTLAGLSVEWTFDPVFSASVLETVSIPAKPAFTPAEVARIKGEAFDNLVNYDFFLHPVQGDQPVKLGPVRAFSARMDGVKLIYRFEADLEAPVDARKPILIGVYDHTYYVEIAVDDTKGVDRGGLPPACSVRVVADAAHPIYGGAVMPQAVLVRCDAS